MAKLLKLRRGTTSQHASFTGAEGEVTIDTTKDTAVVHDGSQAGGRPLAREDMSNVSSASIAGRLGSGAIQGTQLENSGVTAGQYGSSSAIPIVTVDAQGLVTAASTTAIDSTTIANGSSSVSVANNGAITSNANHDFASGIDVTGNITATGTIASNNITITDGAPKISFVDTNNNDDFAIKVNSGSFKIVDTTDDNDRFAIDSSGNITATGTFTTGSHVITGNITVSGTVDGVDVAALKTAKDSLSTTNGTLVDGVQATTKPQSNNGNAVATTAYVRTAIGNIQAFVSGMILIWSGAANAIPSGWVLCNGSNSTPDLRDRFVIGAGNSYSVDATGGSTTINSNVTHSHSTPNHTHGLNGHTHTTPNHHHGLNGHTHNTPNHSHSVNNHTHSISGSVSGNTNNTGGHSHNISAWNNDSTQGTQGRLRAEHDGNSNFNHGTGNSGNHNHSFSGSFSGNSGNSAPNTSSSGASNTGANNGNTTTTGSGATDGHNGNTTSAGASNTGNSGSGSTVSVLNPYYALCYIMKT
jgi:hypothetical protein